MKKIYASVFILFANFISHSQIWSYVGSSNLNQRANVVYTDSATNALYVGGFFTSPSNRIAKWDGATLSNLGTGMNGEVLSITRYNGDLYAGGNYTTAGGVIASNIAKWNGSAWSAVAGGTESNTNVNALCVYNGELYAGGTFETAGTTSVTAIAKWNGSTWSSVGTGMSINATVHAMVVYNNELYVGGNFTTAGGVSATHIAKWNGTSWSTVGTGMDFRVQALHVWNGNLYAGGRFSNAGGSPANYFAKWNGSAWSAVGTGFNTFVYSIGSYNGELYAGGTFTTAGGNPAQGIAKWNGSAWSNVNEGFNGEVSSLSVYKGQLYAGGSMGYVVPYFAVWDNIPPGTNRFQKVYKGANASPNSESVFDVEQTPDWGYVIAGHTTSYGGANGDAYIIKTDTAGAIAWAKVYGTAGNWETARSVVTASDGSMVTTGLRQVGGNNDVFAMGMDKNGATTWIKSYGTTSGNEQGWDVKQLSNVEYVMSGTTGTDPLMIKCNGAGNIVWSKKYVTAQAEEINSLELTTSGGFILAGTTGTSPNNNMYIMNMDSNGNVLWDRSFGGTGEEKAYMAIQTNDGGFIIGGRTSSYGAGGYDGYLVKLNSAGAVSWSKTYGTSADFEEIHGLIQNSSGEYLLTGFILYPSTGKFDALSIKIASDGSLISSKSYGGPEWESTVNMDKCSDGGLVLVGQTNSFPYSVGSDYNIYMVKTDSMLNSGSCHQNNQSLIVGSPTSAVSTPGAVASNAALTEVTVAISEATAPFTAYELNPTVSISKINVSCNNGTNGQASAIITGGIPPFTYLWSNNATTSAISNLSANNYTVTVTDSTLCSATQTVSISQPSAYSVSSVITNVSCFGGSNGAVDVTVSGSTPPYTYTWSPGIATTQDISNLSINNYSLTISDANSCTASTSAIVSNAILPIPICLVTVDTITSLQNMLVWEKPVTTAIDSFRIYRNISSVMKLIAAQSYSAVSTFVDATSGVNPKIQAYEYAISVVDSCGGESTLSPTHKTIHQVSPIFTPPNTYDLLWSDYQGFTFTDYEIWRDLHDDGNWTKLGTVPFGLAPQYTDLAAPSDSARYRIIATPSQPCVATIKNPNPLATTVKSSKSNSSDRVGGPTSSTEIYSDTWFSVSPNPSSGIFTLSSSKHSFTSINIYNILGENMYSQNVNAKNAAITIPGIAKGIYQLQVTTNSGIVNRKIVISK